MPQEGPRIVPVAIERLTLGMPVLLFGARYEVFGMAFAGERYCCRKITLLDPEETHAIPPIEITALCGTLIDVPQS